MLQGSVDLVIIRRSDCEPVGAIAARENDPHDFMLAFSLGLPLVHLRLVADDPIHLR